MKYKLIAIDMDGTLLNNKHKVSNRNKEIIKKLVNQGVNFVLASGRPYQALHSYTKELEVYLPLITNNGSIIISSLDGRVYNKVSLSLNIAEEIIEYAQNKGHQLSLYFDDEVKTFNQELAEIQDELEGMSPEVISEITLSKAPIKVIYYDNKEKIEESYKILSKEYSDSLYITSSEENILEIMDARVSKGKGLEYMMKRMNIQKEEVMAIGNNFNDVTMFKVAGMAVAMENSPKAVKEKADFVTKSNQDDGVAYALDKLVLNI